MTNKSFKVVLFVLWLFQDVWQDFFCLLFLEQCSFQDMSCLFGEKVQGASLAKLILASLFFVEIKKNKQKNPKNYKTLSKAHFGSWLTRLLWGFIATFIFCLLAVTLEWIAKSKDNVDFALLPCIP